jgi:hypothetical protein
MAGNQAELVALIQRLELVTSRLEKVPGAGGAVTSSNKDAGMFIFVIARKWELMMRQRPHVLDPCFSSYNDLGHH